MKKNFTFAGQLTTQGTMAEWLGNGLQNRLQRFESAWYLKAKVKINVLAFFSTLSLTPVTGNWVNLKLIR